MASKLLKPYKLNILVAYPYFSEQIIQILENEDPRDYRLIVDSGAFSAYNCGMTVTLEEYCKFLKMLAKRLPKFESVQLDVVFDHEGTEENYKKMQDMGFNTNPVFTRGAPSEYFMDLLEQDNYVFVGGVQGGSGATEFAKWCLERSKGKRVHYLAFVRPDFLKYYKPFSTDASSWASAARFGNLGLYRGNGRLKMVNKMEFQKKPTQEVVDLINRLGFTWNEMKYLGKKDAWNVSGYFNLRDTDDISHLKEDPRSFAIFMNICSYIVYSYQYEQVIGTRMFLAVPTPQFMTMFFQAKKFLRARGVL